MPAQARCGFCGCLTSDIDADGEPYCEDAILCDLRGEDGHALSADDPDYTSAQACRQHVADAVYLEELVLEDALAGNWEWADLSRRTAQRTYALAIVALFQWLKQK